MMAHAEDFKMRYIWAIGATRDHPAPALFTILIALRYVMDR